MSSDETRPSVRRIDVDEAMADPSEWGKYELHSSAFEAASRYATEHFAEGCWSWLHAEHEDVRVIINAARGST